MLPIDEGKLLKIPVGIAEETASLMMELTGPSIGARIEEGTTLVGSRMEFVIEGAADGNPVEGPAEVVGTIPPTMLLTSPRPEETALLIADGI